MHGGNGGVGTNALIVFVIPNPAFSSCFTTRLSQGRDQIKVQLKMSSDSIFQNLHRLGRAMLLELEAGFPLLDAA